jgi:hypothetical protein
VLTGPPTWRERRRRHEALARAQRSPGRWDEAERHERLAQEAGARIAEADERRLLLSDLASLPRRPPSGE